MTFVIGSASGLQGETTSIDVQLETGGDIFETQNDIILGPEIQVATTAAGQPRCTVNPALDKNATFALDCDDGGVCTLRAIVLASAAADSILNGSVLYSCEITIDLSAALGMYPLACAISAANASQSTGCIDGWVDVMGALPTPISTHHEDEEGCHVADRMGRRDPWLLTLPVMWLALRRRRWSARGQRLHD